MDSKADAPLTERLAWALEPEKHGQPWGPLSSQSCCPGSGHTARIQARGERSSAKKATAPGVSVTRFPGGVAEGSSSRLPTVSHAAPSLTLWTVGLYHQLMNGLREWKTQHGWKQHPTVRSIRTPFVM